MMTYLTFDNDHEWFDCKEKMPGGFFQYEYVLVYTRDRDYEILYYIYPENTWQSGGGLERSAEEITHWTYLPKEPK